MEKNNSTSNSASASPNSFKIETHGTPFSYSEVIPYISHIRTEKTTENKNILLSTSLSPIIKDYLVVWLNLNSVESNEVHQNNILQLQQVINSVKSFSNTDECINFITDNKNAKIFLIVSEDLGKHIVNLIENLHQLESIYIFGNNQSNDESWIQQCHKVKGVFNQIEHICNSVNNQIRRYDNYFTNISSFALTGAPIRGLNELDQSFMYSQLLKEIFLKIQYDDKPKEMEELISILRNRYANEDVQLKLINEFKQTYDCHPPIKWYTKEAFIYKTLNDALRTQNINMIVKMGFFIQDLQRQIEQIHSERTSFSFSTIYRGQVIPNTTFEKMKNSKGGLISFNNFLSTSINEKVSLIYAEVDPQKTDTVGVLFEIQIDPSTTYASFAALTNVTQFDDEEEILFSMNTVFRICDIEQIKNYLWRVKLSLTNDNDEQLKRVTDSIRQEIGGETEWHRLGYLMIMLDENDKAEEIYNKLFNITPVDKQKERAVLYNQFGIIYNKKGDYKAALSHFQRTAEIEKKLLPSDHLDLALTYNNIAEAHHSIGNHSTALSFHEKTLKIREKWLSSNDPLLAITHSNMAGVHLSMGDYHKARFIYQKALEIGEQCFPSKHPDLGTIYDNLASLHTLMGEYSEALSFYEKVCEINQKILPPNHMLLLTTYNNIASTYNSIGRYSDALLLYKQALEAIQKSSSLDHLTIALINSNIGTVYCSMGDRTNALLFCQKALDIQKKSVSHNDPMLATIYSNLGQVYRTMGKFKEARSNYEKTLEIDKKYYPSDHPNFATTYNNLGGLCLDMGLYSDALPFFQESLKIRKKCFSSNHPSLASVYNNIGRCHEETSDHLTAISFYKKALSIHKQSTMPNYPELAIVYNNMGKTYQSMKDYSTALSYFRQTLEIEEKSLGTGHLNSAYTHHHIAYALEGLHQYEEAFYHIKKAIDISTHALKPDDDRLKIFQNHSDIFLLKVLFIIYTRNKQTS